MLVRGLQWGLRPRTRSSLWHPRALNEDGREGRSTGRGEGGAASAHPQQGSHRRGRPASPWQGVRGDREAWLRVHRLSPTASQVRLGLSGHACLHTGASKRTLQISVAVPAIRGWV